MPLSSILKIKKQSRQKAHECCQAALEAEGPHFQGMHHLAVNIPALMLLSCWEGVIQFLFRGKSWHFCRKDQQLVALATSTPSMGATGFIKITFLTGKYTTQASGPKYNIIARQY